MVYASPLWLSTPTNVVDALPQLGMAAEKLQPPSQALIRPPTVATAPARARPRWKAPLEMMVCVCSRGASAALSLSLSVEVGRSTFGIMAGI